MPDDHSKSVPPLPIPNRTVKQLCADDSAATSVKVGYRQASYMKTPHQPERAQDRALCSWGFFAFSGQNLKLPSLRWMVPLQVAGVVNSRLPEPVL